MAGRARRPGRDHHPAARPRSSTGLGTSGSIAVSGLNRREALAYLSSRLTDYPDQRIEALDLGEDLDGLPLGAGPGHRGDERPPAGLPGVPRAAGRATPAHVRGGRRLRRRSWPPGRWPPSARTSCRPTGLAWPTLVLTAMLDHHGVPGAVLTSPAACSYITGRPSTAGAADQNMVRAAINNLAAGGPGHHRPGQPGAHRADARQRPGRGAGLPAAGRPRAGRAGRRGRAARRPGRKRRGRVRSSSRRCGTAPRRCGPTTAGVLWKPEAHPLLFRAGLSLEHSGLSERGHRVLAVHGGHQHPAARARRTRTPWWPGTGSPPPTRRPGSPPRPSPCSRRRWPTGSGTRDPSTPETIAARGHLAHAYTSAGRAGRRRRPVRADGGRLRAAARPRPPGHAGRAGQPGRRLPGGRAAREASPRYELLLDRRRAPLGAGHPTTLGARAGLAAAYAASGQAQGGHHAVRAGAGRPGAGARPRPPGHHRGPGQTWPRRIRAAGSCKEAIAQYERVLADRERVQGADHPDTIAARANLAYAYRSAGRLREARAASTSARWPTGAGPGPGPPGHPDRALQPGRRATSRRAGWPTRSRSTSARWPTASGCSGRATWRP